MKEKIVILVIVSTVGRCCIRGKTWGNFNTQCKSSPADFVTDIDRQSQAIILEELTANFPDHHVVGEE